MGFKLGKAKQPQMTYGTLRSKLKFGGEAGGDASVPGTPVIRKPLDEGILGEANMDGSIDISPNVDKNSQEFITVMKHEQCHIDQMEEERAAYGDGWDMWEGKIYNLTRIRRI